MWLPVALYEASTGTISNAKLIEEAIAKLDGKTIGL